MAVYTEISDDELEAFVARYDIGHVVGCKGIAEGVENSNYLLQTTKGPFILTLYERRVNPADLPFFLGLMEHLSRTGLKCPLPVPDREGQALQTLCGKPAAIISFLQGMWPRRIAPWHCAELGKALAQMHVGGMSYDLKRDNSLSVRGWRELYERIAPDAAENVEKGLHADLARELDTLEKAWPTLMPEASLPAGIIHADLFPDNVFFLDNACSGLIDFYFACTDFLAYDVAICMNAWCFEPGDDFNVTKANHLLANYQSLRKLSDAEKKALPLLARGAAMRFLLTRLYDWVNTPPGAMVKPKDPREYLHKLNFHRGVRDIAAYGLS
jgi:homoserine kinase type II